MNIRKIIVILLLCVTGHGVRSQCPTATTQGNDFWVMFLYNRFYSTEYSLFAAGDEAATITVTNPRTNWSTTVTMDANSFVTITIPEDMAAPGTLNQPYSAGLHITSTANISLYASNHEVASFDITTVLPTSALRSHYISQDYPGGRGAEIGMVAIEDNTTLTIRLSAPPDNTSYLPDDTLTVNLMQGETFQMRTNTSTQEGNISNVGFSGTEVSANKPFAMFQGNQCVQIPNEYFACDHIYEQAIPSDYWGKSFVIVPSAERSGGDIARITAGENNCQIYINNSLATTIQSGGTHQIVVPSAGATRVETSQPATVCLYMSSSNYGGQPGDPASVIIPPIEQGVCNVTFRAMNTSRTSYHYTNIVTRTSQVSGMTLDGTSIASNFIALDTAYSYSKLSVSPGVHTLGNSTGNFVAHFYGTGYLESYAYTAGMGLRNLRNELIINGEESHSWGENITICYYDTIHFSTRTNGTDTAVLWFMDGVQQPSNGTMHLDYHFDSAGTYQLMALMHGLCDTQWCDTMRATIIVEAPFIGTEVVTVCDQGYTFRGVTYTTSGVHIQTGAVAQGCDSIFSLHLTVNHSTASTVFDTVVENQLPHLFNGHTFLGDTLHFPITITNAAGCDSVIDYSLFVHRNVDTTLYDTLCHNDLPFTWNNVVFDTAVNAMVTLTRSAIFASHTGSDSLITMNLTVHPTFDHHSFDTICSNHPITFCGSTYDTAGVFTHTLLSLHLCDSLSTLHLQVWPAYDSHTYDTICDDSSSFFIDSAYRQTGVFPYQFLTVHACDSLQTLHLKVYPTYSMHVYDTIYDGDIYPFGQEVYDTTGVYPTLLQGVFGCDSLRILHLQCNRRTYNDSTLCQNSLPLLWNGVSFTEQGVYLNGEYRGPGTRVDHTQTFSDSVHLAGLDGIDSLVVMRVTAIDTSATYDHITACDSLLWLDNHYYMASTTEPFLHFENQWGCDSIHHLDLSVYLSTYEEAVDTFCHGQTYHWRRFNVSSDSAYLTLDYYLTDTLRTAHNCDSVLAILLTKMAQPHIDFTHEIDCYHHGYRVTATTDAAYHRWSANPTDPLLNGFEDQLTVAVSPSGATQYSLYTDYRETPLCPFTKKLTLYPLDTPEVHLQVNPAVLRYNSLDFEAHDISKEYDSRTWLIDGIPQDETSRVLHGRGDLKRDTIAIGLSLYNGQCHDTAVYLLPLLKVVVYAPNVFVAGSDGENNRFTLSTQGITDGELFIYNREGLLVYHTTDFENLGWDGGNCPQGNYVWRFNYHATDFPTSLKTDVGTVLLLR